MVQITERDERMLDWLSVVRIADIEAIRWALGAYLATNEPVAVRRANHWVSRLMQAGLLDRTRPTFRDSSIVWATHQAIGKPAPNLFRQTTRHEVSVSLISARDLAAGFTWKRDRKPSAMLERQADGVAQKGDHIELVEVELTPKTWQRYKQIIDNHTYRLDREGITQVSYYCTADATRIVNREADKYIFETERHRLRTETTFDVRGHWIRNETS